MKIYLVAIITLLLSTNIFSQTLHRDSITVLEELIVGDDTFPVVKIDQVQVIERKFANNIEEIRYHKFRRKVYRVYPYAQMAKELLAEIDEAKASSRKKRHFNKYKKKKEDLLREKFEDELKNLTVTEGKILVKLINRETGNSCYRLIKELRSGFTAFLWQKVGKRYGYNLKEIYDPESQDNFDLEFVVSEIEGTLDRFYSKGG